MSILQLILLIIIIILIIISAIYSVKAAAEIAKLSNYESDDHLDLAHKWLTYASIVGWVGVALLFIIIFLLAYTRSSRLAFPIFFALAIVISLGVLAAMGWSQINQSKNKDVGIIKTARSDATISALTALIGGVLLMGIFIYLVFFSTAKSEESKKQVIIVSDEDEGEDTSTGIDDESESVEKLKTE